MPSDTGDTAWMLVSTGFVLMMMPGLAFFEAGLLRSKNAVSILVQVFSGIALLSVLWCSIGFTLVFGEDVGGAGIIGHPIKHCFLTNVPTTPPMEGIPELANRIPPFIFVAFQNMFACITPILVTGAVAERIKFSSFILFITMWEFFCYYPLAHWIWGQDGWLAKLGVQDFAGGIVIHASSGTAALVLCRILGHRAGWPNKDEAVRVPHHSLPLAAVGGGLLWLGWFSFNGGSAFRADDAAAVAIINSHVAACTSCIVSVLISWLTHQKKPSFLACINGAIAGLAGITPCAGYIDTPWAFLIGAILGASYHVSAYFVAEMINIDDALEVSSVHGLTGCIGSILTGVFSNNDNLSSAPIGAIHGNWRQLWVQAVGVAVAVILSGFVTLVVGLGLQCSWFGLKVTFKEEVDGLDVSLHGERAYNIDTSVAALREKLLEDDELTRRREASSSNANSSNNGLVRGVSVSYQAPEIVALLMPPPEE